MLTHLGHLMDIWILVCICAVQQILHPTVEAGLTSEQVIISGQSGTFDEAQTYCRSRGYKVIRVKNAEENELVYNIAVSNQLGVYWMDGSDSVTEGRWVNSDNEVLTYLPWDAPPQPDNAYGGENCLEGLDLGKKLWNDARCYLRIAIICYNYTGPSTASPTTATKTYFESTKENISFSSELAKNYAYFVKITLSPTNLNLNDEYRNKSSLEYMVLDHQSIEYLSSIFQNSKLLFLGKVTDIRNELSVQVDCRGLLFSIDSTILDLNSTINRIARTIRDEVILSVKIFPVYSVSTSIEVPNIIFRCTLMSPGSQFYAYLFNVTKEQILEELVANNCGLVDHHTYEIKLVLNKVNGNLGIFVNFHMYSTEEDLDSVRTSVSISTRRMAAKVSLHFNVTESLVSPSSVVRLIEVSLEPGYVSTVSTTSTSTTMKTTTSMTTSSPTTTTTSTPPTTTTTASPPPTTTTTTRHTPTTTTTTSPTPTTTTTTRPPPTKTTTASPPPTTTTTTSPPPTTTTTTSPLLTTTTTTTTTTPQEKRVVMVEIIITIPDENVTAEQLNKTTEAYKKLENKLEQSLRDILESSGYKNFQIIITLIRKGSTIVEYTVKFINPDKNDKEISVKNIQKAIADKHPTWTVDVGDPLIFDVRVNLIFTIGVLVGGLVVAALVFLIVQQVRLYRRSIDTKEISDQLGQDLRKGSLHKEPEILLRLRRKSISDIKDSYHRESGDSLPAYQSTEPGSGKHKLTPDMLYNQMDKSDSSMDWRSFAKENESEKYRSSSEHSTSLTYESINLKTRNEGEDDNTESQS